MLDLEHIEILSNMIDELFGKKLTMEDVGIMTQLGSTADCKEYLSVMLDFYFDVMNNSAGKKVDSYYLHDANLWLQTIFTKACNFKNMLDGVGFQRTFVKLNSIIDVALLFTVARRIYESLVVFEILFIIPDTEDKKTILYNLFMSAGLSERLKDLDDDMKSCNQERITEEVRDIEACKQTIEETELYKLLDANNKNIIQNALRKKGFRYIINNDNSISKVDWEEAYSLLRIRKDMFEHEYSFFSLQGHPSYLALIQFRDAYKDEYRADLMMAKHAVQCVLSCMSIFIVDYMKLFPDAKKLYDSLELPRKFAIGMYEDALRGEHKFK